MKEIVARATIKTDKCFNTGYIYIKDNLIEGFFSLDYAKITLNRKKLSMHLEERCIYLDDNDFLHDVMISSDYSQLYKYDTLYIPDTYLLSDESGSVLTLNLEDIVHDSDIISRVLANLNQIRS